MNTYPAKASEAEAHQGPVPSIKEWVITAQALGMALNMGVPILECLSAVIVITPNAALRYVLGRVSDRLRDGQDIVRTLQAYSEMVDETFMHAVGYGENVGTLDVMLLMYAKDMVIQPHAVAQQIGRSPAVQKFTTHMAENLVIASGREAIYRVLVKRLGHEADGDFRTVLSRVSTALARTSLYEALSAGYPHTFDRLYLNMVKAGEVGGKLAKAFDLLATS